MKIKSTNRGSKLYPPLLAEIASPPQKLYYLGKLPGANPCVAIVGSRKATASGRAVTYRLAYDLASVGIIIVSGLALGIDSVAHKAALEAGGKSIGVLACGLNQIYPATNRELAKKLLASSGALLSEYHE